MSLIQVARTVVSIYKALNTISPLPVWGDPNSVTAWLDRIGLDDSIKSVILMLFPTDGGVTPSAISANYPMEFNANFLTASEDEIRSAVDLAMAEQGLAVASESHDNNVPEFGLIPAVLLTNAIIQIAKTIRESKQQNKQ